MMKSLRIAGLGILALAPVCGANAESAFAMGIKAGTTGLGVEAAIPLSDSWNLRGGLNGFSYGYDFEEEGIEYDGDLRLRSASIMADWHVFGGAFRVSAGAFLNGNELKGKAESGELEIGDNTYDAKLEASIDWRAFAPYLGIGWGNSVKGGRLTFSTDLGVMFTGSPTARLVGEERSGTVDLEEFKADLRREEANLNDELRDVKYYPVVTFGVSYRF